MLLAFFTLLLASAAQEKSHVERFTPVGQRNLQVEREATARLKINPNDSLALRRRGVVRLRLGRTQEAIDDLSRALALTPQEPALLAALAEACLRSGRVEQALEAARDAVRLDPNQSSARMLLGRILLMTGQDAAEAVVHLEAALDADPYLNEARFALLTGYRALGKTIEAAAQLRILQAAYPPGEARVMYAEGLIASDLGQMEIAIDRFRSALNKRPDLPGARFDLAMTRIRLGRWLEAVDDLESLNQQRPGSPQILYLLALSLYNSKRLQAAQEIVGQALRIAEDSAPAQTLHGILHWTRGDVDLATASLRRAIELDPEAFDAYFYLGRSLHARRELNDAAAALRKAVAIQAHHRDALFLLASCEESLGRGREAEELYRRIVQAFPEESEGHLGLGALLAKRGLSEEAIRLLRQAAQLDPARFEAHLQLGRALADVRRWQEAIPALLSAVEIDPQSSAARYQLALALQRAGRREEAKEQFDHVKRLNALKRTGGMGESEPDRPPS